MLWKVKKNVDRENALLLFELFSLSTDQIKKSDIGGDIILNKKQPSFGESVRETTTRLAFLEKLVRNISSSKNILGLISGGSMSYGRFFNVRGGYPNASDLDLIVVTSSNFNLADASKIVSHSLGMSDYQCHHYFTRVERYLEMKRLGKADVLSHKFSLPSFGFDMSTHVMEFDTFEDITLSGVEDAVRGEKSEIKRYVQDYKPAPFAHRVLKQRDFEGNWHEFAVIENSVESDPQEVISSLVVYGISDGLFIPGIYLNIILPMFEVEYDNGSSVVNSTVNRLKILVSQLINTYLSNGRCVSLSKSHPREILFSSKITKLVNSGVVIESETYENKKNLG